MKILLVAPMMPGSKGVYTAEALRALGHEVIVFDEWNLGEISYSPVNNFRRVVLSRRPPLRGFFIARMNRLFLSVVRQTGPDLILVIRGDTLLPETLKKAGSISRAFLANWFPDPIINPEVRGIYRSISCYDRFFVKDTYSYDTLRTFGYKNVDIVYQCCAPTMHRTVSLTEAEHAFFGSDIAYAGSIHPLRTELFSHLVEYDFRIWVDRRWLRVNRDSPLFEKIRYFRTFGTDQTKLFNAAKIVLNPIRPTDVSSINLRAFEIAGCGGFQLLNEKKDVEKFFVPDKEIVTFSQFDDLLEKIDYYLEHENERREIAQKGQQRAHEEHTYEKRLEQILSIMHL